MNIKRIVLPIVIACVTDCVHAQSLSSTAHEWKATVNVVDEAGMPISGANVTIAYFVKPPPGESIAFAKKVGQTDANGIFAASEQSTSTELDISAQKGGYYTSGLVYELGRSFEYSPVKWSPHVTLELRKVGQAIPMYAKKIVMGVPPLKVPTGYDFIVGDWVNPYGRGQHSDIIFQKEFSGKAPYDYDFKLTISFPNAGDGIQNIEASNLPNTNSLFKSPRQAPEEGYQPQLLKEESAHPGQPSKEPDNDPNRMYFIRVQTILDQTGKVKSALYGKIYGDFMQFTYYLNPTPNDRNIEFDPTQNLLKGLKPIEQVKAP